MCVCMYVHMLLLSNNIIKPQFQKDTVNLGFGIMAFTSVPVCLPVLMLGLACVNISPLTLRVELPFFPFFPFLASVSFHQAMILMPFFLKSKDFRGYRPDESGQSFTSHLNGIAPVLSGIGLQIKDFVFQERWARQFWVAFQQWILFSLSQ